jgi:hypothetical protein
MTRKRHTPEQIIRKPQTVEQILKRGQTVADLCRALEVSWGSPRLKLDPYRQSEGTSGCVQDRSRDHGWRPHDARNTNGSASSTLETEIEPEGINGGRAISSTNS